MENLSTEIKFCDGCENRKFVSYRNWEGDRIDEVFCKVLNRTVYTYFDEWDKAEAPKDCPLLGM